MTTKHERKRWKTKRGRRAAAAANLPPVPISGTKLSEYARELVTAGICTSAVLGSRPKPRTPDK